MKKLYATSAKLFVIIILLILLAPTIKAQSGNEKQSCEKIIFTAPALKCGVINWDDQIISNWLKNNCVEKCDDSLASGYSFNGKINGTNKSNSLKVTITTDRDYAQPVRFNPNTGVFEGKVFFDKSNRQETIVKVMLRDSNRLVINTFEVKLID